MEESKYYKKHFKKEPSNKPWLTKILVSIIIILLCLIITNFSSSLKEKFISNVLEHHINFFEISKIYDKYIGSLKEENKTIEVSESNDFLNLDKEEYNGSYKLKVGNEYPFPAVASGIIVYNGTKDEYQGTVIIQGNDGIDIWYSNIYMTEYNIYDYIKKGDIIGSSTQDEVILTIMKNGKKISYDEYFI